MKNSLLNWFIILLLCLSSVSCGSNSKKNATGANDGTGGSDNTDTSGNQSPENGNPDDGDESENPDGPGEEEPVVELPENFSTLALMGDHLTDIQNDDGSFGWQRDVNQPWFTGGEGFQNVTGVIGLAILALHDLDARANWETSINEIAAYLDTRLTLLIADPAAADNNFSCTNWTFLVRYLERFPNEALETRLIQGVNALLDSRDAVYGNNPDLRIDGLFNRMIQGRASIPAIIPWDMASCVVSTAEMARLDATFSEDASDSVTEMANHIRTVFIPAHDANPARSYADVSLGLSLSVLARLEPATYEELINALTLRLLPLTDAQGRISSRPITYPPVQSTAYGLLGLKSVNLTSETARSEDFLVSLVNEDGIIAFPNETTETFLVEGEVILSLIADMNTPPGL